METEEAIQAASMGLLFKSYYVVWKQGANTIISSIKFRLFKSYYVVWKQIELKTKKVGNTIV